MGDCDGPLACTPSTPISVGRCGKPAAAARPGKPAAAAPLAAVGRAVVGSLWRRWGRFGGGVALVPPGRLSCTGTPPKGGGVAFAAGSLCRLLGDSLVLEPRLREAASLWRRRRSAASLPTLPSRASGAGKAAAEGGSGRRAPVVGLPWAGGREGQGCSCRLSGDPHGYG